MGGGGSACGTLDGVICKNPPMGGRGDGAGAPVGVLKLGLGLGCSPPIESEGSEVATLGGVIVTPTGREGSISGHEIVEPELG